MMKLLFTLIGILLMSSCNTHKPTPNQHTAKTNIKSHQTITSPYKVTVYSNHTWNAFEGELGTVTAVDNNGKQLGFAILFTEDINWMGKVNVPFSGTLSFHSKDKKPILGKLQFHNNNPSQTEGKDLYFEIPVTFKR